MATATSLTSTRNSRAMSVSTKVSRKKSKASSAQPRNAAVNAARWEADMALRSSTMITLARPRIH